MQIDISILPQTAFQARLPHNNEQSSVIYSTTLLVNHFKYSWHFFINSHVPMLFMLYTSNWSKRMTVNNWTLDSVSMTSTLYYNKQSPYSTCNKAGVL